MSGIELPKHVHKVTARGRNYYYYQLRRNRPDQGPRIKLEFEPRDPRFWADIKAIEGRQEPDVMPRGTVGTLVAAYLASPDFSQLAEATRRDYLRYLKIIDERFGRFQADAIRKRHAYAFRDSFADRPSTANHAVAVLKALFEWGVEHDELEANPADKVKRLAVDASPAEPWPAWAIRLAMEKGRPEFATFVALALYTGQRTADVVAMTLTDLDRTDPARWKIHVVQSKTGKRRIIPVHRGLRPVLEAALARGSFALMPRPNGQSMTAEQFRAMYYREIRRSELRPLREARLKPHGLRKLAAVTLREIGMTDAQIDALIGMGKAMVEHYTISIDHERLAEEAISAWESRTGNGNGT